MPTQAKLSHIILGIVLISGVLFAGDFLVNNYSAQFNTDKTAQGSILGVSVGSDLENNVGVLTETENNDGVLPVTIESVELNEKNLFTDEVFALSGLNNAKIEDLKQTNKLFEFFEINETKNNPMIKQALYADGEIVAYVYHFTRESYALGLSYARALAQVKANLGDGYTLNEPSSFGERSFYITSDNPNNDKITSLVQIQGTLLGLEYSRDRYQTVQKLIDLINQK